jgi:DNA-binding MarR family transcriptional regulator
MRESSRNQNRCICIYLGMSRPSIPKLPCICANFRRSSRALTQVYEQALRHLGIRATQFTILQALSFAGETSQGRLGEMLAMDSTSLTRTLAIMRRVGWVSEQPGEDRRERRIRLSVAGESKLGQALPIWEKVQLRLRRKLGKQEWEALLQLTHHVTEIAKVQGGSL